MRQLRFVSLTEDGNQLVLEATDSAERFTVTVGATLRDAVRADLPRLPVPAPEPAPAPLGAELVTEPPIGPREIQMRVRAGETPEQLATAHGMTLERVLRFAGPVVDERRRIADEARRARARRTAADGTELGDPRVVQFGEAVDERFGAHGIDAESVDWDSRRREDGEWIVVASWLGGDGTHRAEWVFHRASRSVTALDDTASDLLSDRPIRPVVPAPARPTLSAAPPLAPGIVAFPPMPDAHTGPIPAIEDVFDQEAAPEGPRTLVPAAPAMLHFDAPPLPLGITDPNSRPAVGTLHNLGVSKRDESDEDKAARARVPSWDDILLGVRRRED